MSYVFKHYSKGSTQGSGSYVFRNYSEQVIPQVEPYITFSSPNSFTLITNNQSKGWDGTIEYSTDKTNWATWDAKSISSGVDGNNNVLYIRGTNNTYIIGTNTSSYWRLNGSNISCIGNIENLLDYQTVLQGQHPPMASLCFTRLFMSSTSLVTAPELSAMTLSSSCYSVMFSGCTALTMAPELPATTLSSDCYNSMFKNCTGLINAPSKLPATVLEQSCYTEMFNGCTNLVTAPAISATTLAQSCCNAMFRNCSNLEQLPALPATTITAFACYYYMFYACNKIKLSVLKTGNYQNAYRIPVTGTGTTQQGNMALDDMFTNTGGTFTGKPNINQTYYTSNAIVNADGTITPAIS